MGLHAARTPPIATSTAEFADTIAAVRANIDAAAARVGRSPDQVRLLPVSKTVPEARLRTAIAAGLTRFGENRVQEALRKCEELSDVNGLSWAIIGHLQTNKAKYVARFAAEFQALDNLATAVALQRRLEIEHRTLDVYVQVNTSHEDSKYGLAPDRVRQFLRQLPQFSQLKVKGLMTLALFDADPARVRACFVLLRELRDYLLQDVPDGVELDGLSMGMSGDYQIAVEEGATVVRIGQAIFGPRALPDSYYWPTLSPDRIES